MQINFAFSSPAQLHLAPVTTKTKSKTKQFWKMYFFYNAKHTVSVFHSEYPVISPHGSCNAAWLQWCLLHPSRNSCLCHNLPPPSPLYSWQHKIEGGMRTKVNVSYCCLNLSVSAGAHSLVPQESVRRASSQPEAPLCSSSQGTTCPCETSGLPTNSPVTFIKHSPAMTAF